MQVKDETSDEGRPAGLMAGAYAAAGIAMKVLVEWQEIAPVRIRLLHVILSQHGPMAIFVALKDADQSAGNLIGHFAEVHPNTRAGGALSF